MAAIDDEANLGYVFHAFHAGASFGYAALDLFLAAAGLDHGFATAQLILPIWESGDSSARVTLTEQWSGAGNLHVAPGIVTIRSYRGGALTCVRGQPGRLHCKLTSPAPILNLGEEGMDWAEHYAVGWRWRSTPLPCCRTFCAPTTIGSSTTSSCAPCRRLNVRTGGPASPRCRRFLDRHSRRNN